MAVDTNFEEVCDRHTWGPWKVILYTGDWFHPVVVERRCKYCAAREEDEP